jgi:hypothetical protein
MSDSTKKSIIINQSFLSGSNKGTTSSNNTHSKKNRPKLSDDIIKPNKLKKMLLDKINAKRKAEQTSSISSGVNNNNSNNNNANIDISKESKIFSSEFKKSLEFLDNYINTKNQNPKIKKANDNSHSKTLKRQNFGTGSLTADILKSLQNNKNSNPQQRNPSPVYTPTTIQPQIITQPRIVTPGIQSSNPTGNFTAPAPAPNPAHMFQKIQLQLPHSQPAATIMPTQPKINLGIGKNSSGNMIYTELPPELQPTVSSPPLQMNMPTMPTMPTMPITQPIIATNTATLNMPMAPLTGEIQEIPGIINNSELDKDENIYNDFDDNDDIIGKTSLSTSSVTFSPVKLSDDAPYGCLKNGKKPTFRAYNKTIKHNIKFNNDNNNDTPHTERQTKLKELQDKHKRQAILNSDTSLNNENENEHDLQDDNNSLNKTKHMSRTKIRRHLRKTITKKFKLGKTGDVVGVLIKNNDTRKNIQREHGLLKNKKLSEVKKYLVEKNLIKIGSMAPPNIVRKIYEDAMLTGELENVGKGVVLHNFLEDKKSW